MSLSVKCPVCAHLNPLGRLFCAKCGTRLEVTDTSVRKTSEPGEGTGAVMGRVIRLLLFLGMLIALYLVSRPVKPMGHHGSRMDGQVLSQKMNLLHAAVQEQRAMSQLATEAEVNGYVAELLKNTMNRTAEGALRFELQDINTSFRDGRVVTVFVSSLRFFQLTYEFKGRPARVDGRFTVEVEGLRLGHLPLPRPAARWVGARMARVFSELEREKRLLDQLSVVEVQDGAVKASTPGP